MPYLQKITLTQFRNYDYQSFNFDASLVAITGKNGSGKTNLLDAIYYLCYTKSYFQSREINNVQYGKEGLRIEGRIQNGQDADKTVCVWKEGKKTISVNDIPYEKTTDHIGRYQAVMIAPDDIALINEGSEQRRKYIDALLSQRDPQYFRHLLAYHKYLAQRNALLKLPASPNHQLLDIYDQQMALHGAYLVQERQNLSGILPQAITRYYDALSAESETISMEYRATCTPDKLLHTLTSARSRDIEYRRTLYGPHTEDWLFLINGHSLKTNASQGQKKSFLIALKLAHILLLQQKGIAPFLLLDDIFEKLDNSRLERLFKLIQEFDLPQIFLTHTQAEDLDKLKAAFNAPLLVLEL